MKYLSKNNNSALQLHWSFFDLGVDCRAITKHNNMERVAVVNDVDDDVDKELLDLMDDDETVGAEKLSSSIILSTDKPEDEMV